MRNRPLTPRLIHLASEQPRAEPVRALIIWPPQILSYFNAGHHLALYQVAGYLRTRWPNGSVRVVDATVERLTWKDIADELFQGQYSVIGVMNDFDGIDGLRRFLAYTRQLSPSSRVFTFGRLSGINPEFFRQYDLDAIVHSGDFETGAYAAAAAFLDGASAVAGVHLRHDERWVPPAEPGAILDPGAWILPRPEEIPHDRYDELYRKDANKFCGIPHRRELVVPAARGCPVGCAYCEVHTVFGRNERRLPVDRVSAYIEESFATAPFEYVAFYAPTFTLDRPWVLELCDRLINAGSRYPWKCATTMHHLDEELVLHMGASGCIRISVGLETLDTNGQDLLPRAKRKSECDLEALASWCATAGTELNCFVIVGLPGTTVAGAQRTIEKVQQLGARARPTVYCPIELMRPDMAEHEISAFNRQLFVEGTHAETPEQLHVAYGLLFGRQPDETKVFHHIPQR